MSVKDCRFICFVFRVFFVSFLFCFVSKVCLNFVCLIYSCICVPFLFFVSFVFVFFCFFCFFFLFVVFCFSSPFLVLSVY